MIYLMCNIISVINIHFKRTYGFPCNYNYENNLIYDVCVAL